MRGREHHALICVALTIALASSLVLCAHEARADLGIPVKVRLDQAISPAESGRVLSATIVIEAGTDAQIEDLEIDGTGWSILKGPLATARRLSKGERWKLDLVAIPARPTEPLVVRLSVHGTSVEWRLDLSSGAVARATGPGKLRGASAAEVDRSRRTEGEPVMPSTSRLKPDLALSTEANADSWVDDEPDAAPARRVARTIRVHGRLFYDRQGTIVGADAATVRIFDDDFIGRQLLASGITDVDGYYDETFVWDPCGTCENDPDIVVEFESANGVVEVEDPILEFNYKWETGEWHNFTGTDLDVGWLAPIDEEDHPALHLLTGVTRLWRWLLVNEGYDTPPVDVQWPATGGTFYSQLFNEIHMSDSAQWSETTLAHEFAHHWHTVLGNLAPLWPWDYCNTICDLGAPPLGCGHCTWCEETEMIAWGEGFAEWFAHFFLPTLQFDYGLAPLSPISTAEYDTISPCGQTDGFFDPPEITEGFTAAVLVDIMDAENDNDPYYAVTSDELNMGTNEILYTISTDTPTGIVDFINAFKTRYTGVTEELWATVRNNGFDLDTTGPPAPTNLYSSTHALNTPDGDSTPEFFWDIPADDFSGIYGFSVCWSCTSPSLPDANPDIGNQNYFVAPPMTPGTYYFNIRAVDNAGNWSADFASYGPFIVDVPDPAEIGYVLAGGWDYRVVPRNQPDASAGSAHVSATLPGNQTTTWWNAYFTNSGEAPTATAFTVALNIDGAEVDRETTVLLAPLELRELLNAGPVNVAGGRHTLTGLLDADDVIAEPVETNNVFGHQFSWTPRSLAIKGTNIIGPAPPDPQAGWGTVTDGSAVYDNVLGYRLPAASGWNAVVMEAMDLEDDYDLRLHTAHYGTDGFTTPELTSAREAGRIDAVLTNGHKSSGVDWDLGVVNTNLGDGDHSMTWVDVIPTSIGARIALSFKPGERLKLLDLNVTAGEAGGVTALLFGQAGDDWQIGWFHEVVETTSLEQALGSTTLDAKGQAAVDISALTPGQYAIVVWRDPKGRIASGELVLKIRPQLPDLIPVAPTNWYAALVPREAGNSNPGWVPAPTILPGDATSTWLNVAVRNESASPAGPFDVEMRVDGATARVLPVAGLAGWSNSLNVNLSRIAIPGGRHTLTMRVDPADVVEEKSETNGVFGAQWVWDPFVLGSGTAVTRISPPAPIAGWSDVTSGGPLWFNADGLRMPDLGGYFQAVAVMPGGPDSNVDLRLHEASTGAQNGFASPLTFSAWGPGQSDFVLVNLYATARRDFDVGVLWNAGSDNYTAQHVVSAPLGNPQIGDHGPFDMLAEQVVRLHQVPLLAGNSYGFEVLPGGDLIDWGISLYPASEAYLHKALAMPQGAAWLNPAGEGEFISADIDQDGTYCVAVWKVGSNDLPGNSEYVLRVYDFNVVAAPKLVPGRFAVLPNLPNPFNPSTTLRFDLPRESNVDIRIYDTSGRLVRTLLRKGFLGAGRQEVTWHGRDDRGRTLASGIYYYRIRSNAGEGVRRMVLLK